MAKKHYTEEEIIRILKEAENGMSVADLLRQYNISQGTFYHWKSAYSGMQVNELKRLYTPEWIAHLRTATHDSAPLPGLSRGLPQLIKDE